MGVLETEKGVEFTMDTRRKHPIAAHIRKGGQRESLEDKEENQKVDFSNDLFCFVLLQERSLD